MSVIYSFCLTVLSEKTRGLSPSFRQVREGVSHQRCIAVIKKQLKEPEDFEKALFEIAARKIDIDLDDGFKYNYQLFGSVLRTIPGLDTQDD